MPSRKTPQCPTTPRRLPDNPRRGLKHLASADSAMADAIEQVGRVPLKRHPVTLHSICCQVIGQQLSMHVAGVIGRRFTKLTGPGESVTPRKLLRLKEEDLRGAGLSGAKIRTIRALAEFWEEEKLTVEGLSDLPDEELIKLLTRVKGIGPWTVKMFLIFSLRRPNVLPQEDLGLRAGMKKIYGMEEMPSIKETLALGEKWAPWCTLGTHYCWEILKIGDGG